MVETKRICNGTFGEVWLDGSYVGECYKAQGKIIKGYSCKGYTLSTKGIRISQLTDNSKADILLSLII